MKYYHCSNCNSCFIASDIDNVDFCDNCKDKYHLRSIQRLEYNELVQAGKDGMSFEEYEEWKRHVAMDQLGKIVHESWERKHRSV